MELKRIMFVLAIAGITVTSCGTDHRNDDELAAKQNTIDSMKMEMARRQVIDSMNLVYSETETDKAVTTSSVTVKKRSTSGGSNSAPTQVYESQETVYGHTGNQPVYQEPVPVEEEKKGWSAKAKGAVIGAGTGAAAGAIINKKNRSKGAIVGGILGAGAGVGAGAVIDRKNDR